MVGNLCAFSARNCFDASFDDETTPLVNPNENAAAGPRKSSGGADDGARSAGIATDWLIAAVQLAFGSCTGQQLRVSGVDGGGKSGPFELRRRFSFASDSRISLSLACERA